MATQGKRFTAAAAKVDRTREFPIQDAVGMVKGAAFSKFDETVDVAVRLGVDPRHADQVVRGTVVLPHGTGKSVRVLVITQGDRVREAEAAGADFVGMEYLQKLKDGWLEADVIVATPDVMGQLGTLGEPRLTAFLLLRAGPQPGDEGLRRLGAGHQALQGGRPSADQSGERCRRLVHRQWGLNQILGSQAFHAKREGLGQRKRAGKRITSGRRLAD